jgi:hypothetical protein
VGDRAVGFVNRRTSVYGDAPGSVMLGRHT